MIAKVSNANQNIEQLSSSGSDIEMERETVGIYVKLFQFYKKSSVSSKQQRE